MWCKIVGKLYQEYDLVQGNSKTYKKAIIDYGDLFEDNTFIDNYLNELESVKNNEYKSHGQEAMKIYKELDRKKVKDSYYRCKHNFKDISKSPTLESLYNYYELIRSEPFFRIYDRHKASCQINAFFNTRVKFLLERSDSGKYEDVSVNDFKKACKTIEEHTNVYLQAKQDISSLISILEMVDIDTINNAKSSYEGDTTVAHSIRKKYLDMLSNNEAITKEMLEEENNKLKSDGAHNWNGFELLSGIHWKLFDVKKDEDTIELFLKNLLSSVSELKDYKYDKVFSMQGTNKQGSPEFEYCLMKHEFKSNSIFQLVFNISGNTSVYCYDPDKKVKGNETLINLDSDTLPDDIIQAFIYSTESNIMQSNYNKMENVQFENFSFFTIRTGKKKEHYDDFINNRIISFTWDDIKSTEGLDEKALEKYLLTSYNKNALTQFKTISNSMQIGDIVLIISSGSKNVDIAVVTSGMLYDESNPSFYRNYRTIEFLKKDVEFDFVYNIQSTITQIRNDARIKLINSAISDMEEKYNEIINNIDINREFKSVCKDIKGANVDDEIGYLNDYKQVIIDGAPGTGKSYGVQKEINEEGIIHERVTFYSDYEYHNFIGSIQPRLNEENVLEYKFIKGPFTKLLDQALSNLEEKHYLVIEELTRGNAAAIFGDVFQLLDRDDDGFSCYPITNNEIFENLCKESAAYLEYKCDGKIVLPPNFSIICTNNSSDQNVFPLDTAFKRRFDYEIESTKPHENFDFKFSIGKIDDISWSKFYQLLNEYILKDLNLKEDKQVGPYFIKDPKGKEQAVKSVQTKLAMYMWNDLHKVYTGSNKAIFTNVYTLADVSELFKTGTRKQILDILTEDFKKHFSLTEEPDEE